VNKHYDFVDAFMYGINLGYGKNKKKINYIEVVPRGHNSFAHNCIEVV